MANITSPHQNIAINTTQPTINGCKLPVKLKPVTPPSAKSNKVFVPKKTSLSCAYQALVNYQTHNPSHQAFINKIDELVKQYKLDPNQANELQFNAAAAEIQTYQQVTLLIHALNNGKSRANRNKNTIAAYIAPIDNQQWRRISNSSHSEPAGIGQGKSSLFSKLFNTKKLDVDRFIAQKQNEKIQQALQTGPQTILIQDSSIDAHDWLLALQKTEKNSKNTLSAAPFAISVKNEGRGHCSLNKQQQSGMWLDALNADLNQYQQFEDFASTIADIQPQQVIDFPITIAMQDGNGKTFWHHTSLFFKYDNDNGNITPYFFDGTYGNQNQPVGQFVLEHIEAKLQSALPNNNVKFNPLQWLTGNLHSGVNACAADNWLFAQALAKNPDKKPEQLHKNLKNTISSDKNYPRRAMAQHLDRQIL